MSLQEPAQANRGPVFRVVVLVVAIAFAMFVLAWENRLESNMAAELSDHAVAIADDVWNFNSRGATAYLGLIADKDRFTAFTVYEESSDVLTSVVGPQPGWLSRLLIDFGLIRESGLEHEIRYEGKVVGRLNSRFVNDAIYVYLYLLLPLLLFLWAIRSFLGTLDEVDRRKRLQEALRTERDLADNLIDTARVVILLLDADGRIVRFNRYLEELSGFRLEDVRGKSWFDVFLPRSEAADIRRVFQATVERENTSGGVNVVKTRAGELRLIEWYNSLLQRDDGSVAAVLSVGHDVTEIKRTESALRDAVHEAEVASEAKSLFLANMSHEVRTPVNGIAVMLGVLGDTALDSVQTGYLNNATLSVDRLVMILDEILDLSKIESDALELDEDEFDVEGLAARCELLFRPIAEDKGLAFEFQSRVPEELARLVGDAHRLERVIANLVGNAVKFTEQGHVRCRLSLAEGDDCLANLEFQVEDTGPGIPLERQEHIFDRFVQLSEGFDKRYGGTGLGLTIARSLVEAMGGQIAVSSDGKGGSRFSFHVNLKLAAAPEPAATKSAGSAEGIEGSYLVVDDDPVSLLGARLLLEKAGCRVTVVEDGMSALDETERKQFDAVLLDVHMPGLDGIEVARRIRCREADGGGHLPLIALTASVLKNEHERYLAAGIDGVLAKPFCIDEVLSMLRSFKLRASDSR